MDAGTVPGTYASMFLNSNVAAFDPEELDFHELASGISSLQN